MCSTELEHLEKIAKFFNEELFVEGDYPFFVNDKDLDRADVVKKKVYRNGIRRSMNLLPVSIQTTQGVIHVNTNLVRNNPQKSGEEKQFSNPFVTFTVHRWEQFVTNQQKVFINDMLNGGQDLYSKQQRWKFRRNIQKRLKMAFIGVGGDNLSIYKIGEIRTKLNLIDKFIDASGDNAVYSQVLKDLIDKQYVNHLVYDLMSEEGRKAIVSFVVGNSSAIKSIYLYEFHDLLMQDKDLFDIHGLV